MLAKCQMLCYSIQVGKRKMLSIRKYGRLVKGLRRRPLTAETGVRFPYLLLKTQEQFVPEFFVVQARFYLRCWIIHTLVSR